MRIWLQFTCIEEYWIDFFLAYIQRSRGECNWIKQWFTINPASIWSELSLERRGITKTQDYAPKLLNFFMIQSKVKIQRKRTPFYRRKSCENRGSSDSVKVDRRRRSCDYFGPRSHDPKSHDLSPVRWRSKAFDASTCRPRSQKRDKSLIVRCPLTRSTVFLCTRACDGHRVDLSPRDRLALCDAIASNTRSAATCPAHLKSQGNIVPHGENMWDMWVYKVGCSNAIALPPQLSNQGPLTRGPFTYQPPHCHMVPHGRPRGLAWPCHTFAPPPRHLGAAWARVALPRDLACHVASAWEPHHISAWFMRIKTPFLRF